MIALKYEPPKSVYIVNPSIISTFFCLACRFPAETIKVDTSGRRFDRMCTTRKSLLHFVSAAEHAAESGAAGAAGQPDGSDGDTIRRRSRPRRSRGKRRNTIAGTDQKEIAEVVNNG